MASVGATGSSANILAALNSGGSSSSAAGESATDEIQNRFLTLLVTQLKNQDPLNPLDNTEITSQLAQMSTVRGVEQLNTTLSSLVDSLADTQAMQAASLIGKTVLVPGSHLTLANGSAYGGIDLAKAAEQVVVSIVDASGNVVQTQNLGANEAGNLVFSWDGATSSGGTAADGSYTFKVSATNGKTAVSAEALQAGTVSALVRSNGGFQLDLGRLGAYGFDDVQQVF